MRPPPSAPAVPADPDAAAAAASKTPAAADGAQEESSVQAATRPKFSKTRSLSSSFLASIRTEEIIRQVTREAEISTEASSIPSALKLDEKLSDGSLQSGQAMLEHSISQEQRHAMLKGTVHMMSKDLTKYGVSRRALLKSVMEDDQQCKTCMTLPMTLIFSMLFVAIFQLHYNTSKLFLQETALRNKIGSGPGNAETAEDIYNWMSGTMLPWLWTIPNVPGAVGIDSVAGHQMLVAGVLLRTARGITTAPCEDAIGSDAMPCWGSATSQVHPPELASWDRPSRRLSKAFSWPRLQMEPLPGGSNAERRLDLQAREARRQRRRRKDSQVWRDAIDRHLHQVRAGLPEPTRRLAGASNRLSRVEGLERQRRLKLLNMGLMDPPVPTSGEIYTKAIPMSMNLSSVLSLIDELRDRANPAIDASTLFFSIDFFIRNNDIEPGVLTHITVNYLFSRGGKIYTELKLETVLLKMKFVVMGILLLYVLFLLRLTVFTVIASVLAIRQRAFKATILRPAKLVDCALIFFGWALMLCVGVESMGTGQFQQNWDAWNDERSTTDQARLQEVDAKWVNTFEDDMQGFRAISYQLYGLVADYNILLLLRFLIATLGHPRLAIITRTIVHGASDLLHLAFVFLLMFLAYVMSGHIFMGQRMEELATFKAALGYCLQIVFQREYQFDRMVEENMAGASLWIVTFILFLVLVMVNIVLAMVFDAYGNVRENVSKNETVYAFAQRVLVQMRLQSSWTSNIDMLVKLSKLPVADVLTFRHVQFRYPEICETQLQMLLDSAAERQTMMLAYKNRNSFPDYLASLVFIVCDMKQSLRLMKTAGSKEAQGTGASAPDAATYATPEVAGGAEPRASPPSTPPEWVQRGVMASLRKQHRIMDDLLSQMDEMNAKMAKRGLNAASRLKEPKPEAPDFKEYLKVELPPPTSPRSGLKVIQCSKKPRVKDASKKS